MATPKKTTTSKSKTNSKAATPKKTASPVRKTKWDLNAAQLAAIQSSQAIAKYDLNGMIVEANAQFLSSMGYALDEVKGRWHSMFISPSEANTFEYREFWGGFSQGRVQAGEVKRVGKGGREVWLNATYTPVLDGQGKPIAVIQVATDITLSKNKLESVQGQRQAIQDTLAWAEFDLDGVLKNASEKWLGILGFALGDIQGKNLSQLLDTRYAASAEYRDLWAAVRSGKTQATDLKCVGKNVKDVWMRGTFTVLKDEQQVAASVVLLASDVTAEKLLGKEVADLRVRSEIINLTSIVSEADLKGDIISINEKFIEVSKYSRDELIGKPHNTTRHPDMPKEVFKEVWSTIGRGNTFRGVIKNRAKDGTPYYVDAVIAPVMGPNGKPEKYIGVRYDITAAEIERQNAKAILSAIDESFAYMEYDTSGNILNANERYLKLMGYRIEELRGKHDRLMVDPQISNSREYMDLWKDLSDGQSKSGTFKRLTKDGSEVWIQAVYAPVKDEMGRVMKFVQIASDVTAEKLRSADYEGQLDAIDKSQATIEFNLDGTIRYANQNFLKTVGYSLEEIKGKHHSMFMEPAQVNTHEYRDFWEQLRSGKFQAGAYKRIGSGGREVWIQASYNPIFDLNGKPFKVVKYASDITATKQLEFQIAETQRRDAEVAIEVQRKVAVVLDIVNAMADGNFEIDIPNLGNDPVGQVAGALQQAVSSIKEALLEVRDVASTVSTAAEQLTGVAQEITAGAQTQASSLEETASSLEEITSTVKQNSDNAQQARQLANGSRDIAEKGGAVVSEAVQAMSEINQSSKKIADIITTIDEIAFQTNLLALNAAVEAARAGEQGRGFAVVAAEVRNLAQRSASAAKEIKNLIQDSVRKVENGTDLVNRSGATLSEIVSSVKRVTDIVSEIAAASKEQLTGVEQVNKAVSQMDRVTQGNAAQTEEMSGTASALLSHSVQLSELVNRFRLESESAPPSRKTNSKASARAAKSGMETTKVTKSPTVVLSEGFDLSGTESGVLEF